MITTNYYEFLQISPNAEPATIHRVFQFLAIRFHPDNPETGDAEKFILLKQAYNVLSNPEQRAKYDESCERDSLPPVPLSTEMDFMDSLKGELNRRLAILALLYMRRRSSPGAPSVSLAEVEKRMGFPRDYLEFTTWYLQKKGYITRADNSDFTLTAEGVDFVEEERTQTPILNKLLTSDSGRSSSNPVAMADTPITSRNPDSVSQSNAKTTDRRLEKKDRRSGAPDLRGDKKNRRGNVKDRRGTD
jgi:curved DNA-binding protein CbpA